MFNFDPRSGAKNLLKNAVQARQGQRLAIIAENPALGLYDRLSIQCINDVAHAEGLDVDVVWVNEIEECCSPSETVLNTFTDYDHVLFCSRLGDQLRFSQTPGKASCTVNYALDIGALGSSSCTVSHRLMREIQALYETETNQAKEWQMSCPFGTNLKGSQNTQKIESGDVIDFTVNRFPVCAPRPISCDDAQGVIALTHWLTSTSNHLYTDNTLRITSPVFVHLKNGKVIDITGDKQQVNAVRKHHERVASYFDADPWHIQSWHAGLNPGVSYPTDACSDIDRWSKTAFASPQYLHFHTCGEQAPGEISWPVFHPTVSFDQRCYWSQGHFTFLEQPKIKQLFIDNGYPENWPLANIGLNLSLQSTHQDLEALAYEQ